MSNWTTDDLPERDRFALWREWRGSQIFGVTAELDRDLRPSFSAALTSRPIGRASVVDITASAYRARRTEQDIARVSADSLCIYQQTAGPRWTVDNRRSDRFHVPTTHMAFGYSDLPYETIPLTTQTFRTRLVKIPLTPSHDPLGKRSLMAPRELRSEPGASALFAAYASAFFKEIDRLDDAAAAATVDILARLAFLAQGGVAVTDTEGGSEAVAEGQLLIVQRFIRHNLHRPDLSVETISKAMRVSPRHLHRLFEPSGTTFSRYVLNERVERVAALFAKQPDGSILDAALACGFNSSSVFYRAFQTHFGMTPGVYRARFKQNDLTSFD